MASRPTASEPFLSKRVNPRRKYSAHVEFKTPRGTVCGSMLNLSRGGMFILAPTLLEGGFKTFFHLRFGERAFRFHLHGEVVWSQSKDASGSIPMGGMGIRFLPNRGQDEKTVDGILSLINEPV